MTDQTLENLSYTQLKEQCIMEGLSTDGTEKQLRIALRDHLKCKRRVQFQEVSHNNAPKKKPTKSRIKKAYKDPFATLMHGMNTNTKSNINEKKQRNQQSMDVFGDVRDDSGYMLLDELNDNHIAINNDEQKQISNILEDDKKTADIMKMRNQYEEIQANYNTLLLEKDRINNDKQGMHDMIAENEQTIKDLTNALDVVHNDYNKLSMENKKNERMRDEALDNLEAFKSKFIGLNEIYIKLKDEKRELNDKYLMVNKEKNRLQKEKDELYRQLTQQIIDKDVEIDTLKMDNNKLMNEKQILNDKYSMIDRERKREQLRLQNERDKQKELYLDLNDEHSKLKEKENINISEKKQQIETLQEEVRINKEKYAKEIDEYKQKLIATQNTKLQQNKGVNMDNNIQIEYDHLLKEHADCIQTIQSLRDNINSLEEHVKKWRNQYFEKQEIVSNVRREQLNIKMKKQQINDELIKCKAEFEEYKKEQQQQKDDMIAAAPCDDIDDDDDEKTNNNKDYIDYIVLSDDEICKILQEDLENYGVDQKKRKKHPLKELRLFHENKAQIIRNWKNSLKNNDHKQILEDLLDELEEKYEDEEDIDAEQIAYNILFDAVIESYDVLHTEHIKIKKNEYVNGTVIDTVWLNIDNFYDLMKRNKLKKRIVNIYKYINNKIETIYKEIQKKHVNNIDDDSKDKLCVFIAKCCCVIWSVLHYDYTIYPENFLLNSEHTKYNDKIHERDGGNMGDDIEYYVFPAIMKEQNIYETKIWVICNDIE